MRKKSKKWKIKYVEAIPYSHVTKDKHKKKHSKINKKKIV